MNMRWIVNFTLIIVVFGTILGLVLGGLNPWTSPAEANRMNVETEHQKAVFELEERLAQAKTESEIQSIQREQRLLDAQYQHDIQALAQDLEHNEIAFKTWMTVLTFMGGALSIAIIISTILWAGSKALASIRSIPSYEKPIHPLPELEPYDPWTTLQYRRQRIKRARQEERKQRKEEITARMKYFRDPARMSKEEYNKRPLAGD